MANGPIHVEVPLSNLFSEESCSQPDGTCITFGAELKEIFADGIIDQKDFDSFKPEGKYEECPSDHFRYDRLRKLYASIKRFSSMDGDSTLLSPFEATCFKGWLMGSLQYFASGQSNSAPATNLDLIGESLTCGKDTKCKIKSEDEKMLLVVHPNFFAKNTGASGNIEREINTARAIGVPVTILLEPNRGFSEGFESPDGYIDDLDPDTFVSSHNGEHAIKFAGKEVVMIGGYFDRCFQRALLDVIRNYEGTQLTIKIPSDAVFSRLPDTKSPLLKMDLEGEGSTSIEERLDLFLALLLKKGDFGEEDQPLENADACVVDWKDFEEIDPATYYEEAPVVEIVKAENTAEADTATKADTNAEAGQTDDVEYIEPTGFDWGIEFRYKDKILFSKNCSDKVPPKVIIVFE